MLSSIQTPLKELVLIVSKDPKVELECKVLARDITTKDAADRICKAMWGTPKESNTANFAYPDGLRVVVDGAPAIHKVCMTNSFRGVPLTVERKTRHPKGDLEVPDYSLKFTMRIEDDVRKDFSGSPMDPVSHVRILNRRSWMTPDGILRVDFSMVKSKAQWMKSFSDILKQTPIYELEIELVDHKAAPAVVVQSFEHTLTAILRAFQQTSFVLPRSDIQRYGLEFDKMGIRFVNPVTLERRHVRSDRPHSILKGYTVTNKADGERAFLVVMKDRRLLMIRPNGNLQWTGFTTTKDVHVGDTMDGEYLSGLNLFCIFDAYVFRGKDVRMLPLMTTDEDVMERPTLSRLGCTREFVKDIATDFVEGSGDRPFRIETKMFLAGDGLGMEESIAKLLDTKFEYGTDGLIFTPRSSPVAPVADRKGNTWLRVYKWKPASQNSIDFLLKYKPGESYDPVLKSRVFKGLLFVSRNRDSDIVYPCETLTGEYVPPALPQDLQRIAEVRDRVPSAFQPSAPRAPSANEIMLMLNAEGTPVDETGTRIEDNTIVECAYDVDKQRWSVMRTRYDKTFQYRKGEPQFGNDSAVADSIWTNIHVPITDDMIRTCASSPPDDTFEDDQYYRDNLDSRDRILRDVYSFHNKIKDQLFKTCVKQSDTLLELAMGRGGDMLKWKRSKPSRVVGFDLSQSNLASPKQGACVRYLGERAKNPLDTMPPVLYIQGDMTQSLFSMDNRYVHILNGQEAAPTKYLEQFAGLTEFDATSCQFALHYACTSEETFRTFAENLSHCRSVFFGTCLDGAAVYSFLFGKPSHVFRSGGQIFGEFVKEYSDTDAWQEEFGQMMRVQLESFEVPVKEALVPFGKVTEILREVGFELESSQLFSEWYTQLSAGLTQDQQTFSFLHRSFVFRRTKKEAPKEEEQVLELPTLSAEVPEAPKKVIKRKRGVVAAEVKALPDPVFFFGADESKGENRYLSNMYVAPFEIDGITFPTVEHYFQWSKAKMMGDEDIASKIMTPPKGKAQVEPKSVKAYGRKVKNFNAAQWDEKKDEIMSKAVRAKFVNPANKLILEKLLATGTRPLAEANPRDKYWGIGTSADTDIAKDPSKWKGLNKLGKTLEAVRKELAPEAAPEAGPSNAAAAPAALPV